MKENITCPACGASLKDSEIGKHLVDCCDLRGSGTEASQLTRKAGGRSIGVTSRKPSLDVYDGNYGEA